MKSEPRYSHLALSGMSGMQLMVVIIAQLCDLVWPSLVCMGVHVQCEVCTE